MFYPDGMLLTYIKEQLEEYHQKTQEVLNNGINSRINVLEEKNIVIDTNLKMLTENNQKLTSIIDNIGKENIVRDKELTKLTIIIKIYNYVVGGTVLAVIGTLLSYWLPKIFN